AIIIVIGNSYAHTVATAAESRGFGDIRKSSVTAISIEPVPEARIGLVEARHGCSVHEEDVQQSVTVIVQKPDARPHRFDEVLVGRVRRGVAEADAGISS